MQDTAATQAVLQGGGGDSLGCGASEEAALQVAPLITPHSMRWAAATLLSRGFSLQRCSLDSGAAPERVTSRNSTHCDLTK